jgi:putative pantetheine hydrolase
LRRRPEVAPEGNTTIGIVATNARLTKEQTNRLATVAHDGLARAVRPAHTLTDGDTFFAIATGEIAVGPDRLLAIEAFAARVVERAIVKGVLAATSLAGVPSVSEWRSRMSPPS